MLIKRALKKEKTNVAIANNPDYNYELAIKKSKQWHTQGNKTSWYSYRSPKKLFQLEI